MTNLQKGIQREISLFKDAIELDGGSIPEVTKSAFCKARKKLKATAFSSLSDLVVEEFYKSTEALLWRGYRVLGIDGSTAQLPYSDELKDHFGTFKELQDGRTMCMACTMTIYDALNHLTLHGSIGAINESETSLLWDCLPKLKLNENDLLVFDRGFPSLLLLFYLRKMNVQFCLRMRNNSWNAVQRFTAGGKSSDIITLALPMSHRAKALELGISEIRFKCRLVRVELDSGETEILLTSLVNEKKFSIGDLKELYGLRWSIEESYKAFKHKVCIENFSGKSVKAVLQDFYVKLFIMNLTAVAVRPINRALKKPSVKLKYTYQVNIIEAVATMKRAVVSFFVTNQVSKGLKRLYERISRITEPIRPGRKFNRKKGPKHKHHMGYKPV
jgi:DDE family transposase